MTPRANSTFGISAKKKVTLLQAAGAPARRPTEARRVTAPPVNPPSDLNSHAKQIQPCHCKKSMCLKLYCDCFASGQGLPPAPLADNKREHSHICPAQKPSLGTMQQPKIRIGRIVKLARQSNELTQRHQVIRPG